MLKINKLNAKIDSKEILKGIPTKEPVYQLPATWITAVEKKNAFSKRFFIDFPRFPTSKSIDFWMICWKLFPSDSNNAIM